MKKLLIVLLFLAGSQITVAQQAGRFRMGMDVGPAIPKGGGIGVLFSLEPKINIANNMSVGLRIGTAALAKDITYYNISEDYEGEVSGNASVTATFDYYLNNGKSNVAPFIGGGFGYYALSSIDIGNRDFDNPDGPGNLEANFKWAPMLRAGVELGKFRMSAEYNFVPPSDLQNINGDVIGEAVNQYFGFTLGFYVGGGRWRNYSGEE